MQRRDLLKTAGGIGVAGVVGGAGLAALSGSVAALSGNISIQNPSVAETDDGSYQYVDVAYWKRIEWEGFDDEVAQIAITSEATTDETDGLHTLYENSEPRYLDPDEGNFFGSADYTSGPGTRGHANFAIGDAFYNWDPDANVSPQGENTRWRIIGHPDFYDSENGWGDGYEYGLPEEPLVTDALEATEDGGSKTTEVALRVTFELFDDSGNALTGTGGVPHEQIWGRFDVTMSNIPADTDAGGEGDSSVGVDEEKQG